MKYYLIIMLFLLSATGVSAKDFLVDRDRGNLSTIEEVNHLKLAPGDKVLFRRGQTYFGSLDVKSSGAKDKPIIYSAYGFGDKPVITGLMATTSVNWQTAGGQIWKTALATNTISNQLATSVEASLYVKPDAGTASMSRNDTGNEYNIMVAEKAKEFTGIQLDLAKNAFEVKAGRYYALKLMARANRSVNIASMQIIETATSWARLTGNMPSLHIGTSWQEVVGYFEVTNDGKEAKINILLNDIPDDTTLDIKDIQFGEVQGELSLQKLYEVGSISFDGKHGRKLSSLEQLRRPLDFYFDNNTRETYVYLDSTQPASEVQLALTRDLVKISKQRYINISGLAFVDGAAHGVSMTNADGIRVTNNDFRYIGGGYQFGNVRYGNGVELWEQGSNIRVDNNKFYEIYDSPMTNQGFAGNQIDIRYDHNLVQKSGLGIEIWLQGGGVLGPIQVDHNILLDGGDGYTYAERPDKRVYLLDIGYCQLKKPLKIQVNNNIFSRSRNALMSISKTVNFGKNIDLRNNLWWQDKPTQIAAKIGDKQIDLGTWKKQSVQATNLQGSIMEKAGLQVKSSLEIEFLKNSIAKKLLQK